MKEFFKNIKGYEGYYQISNLGNIKSLERVLENNGNYRTLKERFKKQSLNSAGYLSTYLHKNGKRKYFQTHQLMAITFLNHIPTGVNLVVNHINFDKLDNNICNLEVITQRKNTNKKHLKSTSKYTGVCWDSNNKKWKSQIVKNGKKKYLGLFKNEYDAYLSYKKELEAK